jgi:DHA3 family macrolide efflux protein-like MFS transporter
VGCLLPLAIPQLSRSIASVKPNYFADMKQGYHYLVSWKGMSYLVILAMLINFLVAPVNALLPLFVKNFFGGDVLKLGWLQTTFGVGVIAGGLIMGAWGGFRRRTVTSFSSFLIWSIIMILFGFTTESLFPLALVLILLSGLTNTMGNAPFGAIFQSVVAKDMQGRFHSLYGSLIGMMAPVGLAIAGPLSDAIGLRAIWYFSGAAIFLLFATAFFSRDLMNIESQKAADKPVAETSPLPQADN